MTFGGDNLIIDINMNGLPIPWVSKVKIWESVSYVTLERQT